MAIDTIQGERQAYLGCLLPTITGVKKQLYDLKNQGNLKYTQEIAQILLEAVGTRFDKLFKTDTFLLATAFHPYFRLGGWIEKLPDAADIGVRRHELQERMEGIVKAWLEAEEEQNETEGPTQEISSSIEVLDMASPEGLLAMCAAQGNPSINQDTPTSRASAIVKKWLAGNASSCFHNNEVFNNEPSLIDLFLRYNTPVPSSAAVERLFSLGKDIARAKRNRLSDDTFNVLMFLKGNSETLRELREVTVNTTRPR